MLLTNESVNMILLVGYCQALVNDIVHTIRYDTICYFTVRSKANMSQLNLPHGTDN